MYKDIPPVALKISTPRPYIIYECQPPQTHEYPGHVTLQKILLQYVLNTIGKSTLEARDYLSWSAFCAKMQSPVSRPPAITSLFPLFRDSAHTAATVKHGMTIIKEPTQMKNPTQVPFLTVDQLLIICFSQEQWLWSNEYVEGQYAVLFGSLHIEMAFLKVIGDWLEGSGWIA